MSNSPPAPLPRFAPPPTPSPSHPHARSPHTPRRSARKTRHHVNVPADTVLTFSTYHPPPAASSPPSSSSSSSTFFAQPKPKPHPRPREQFVQANFRFLVSPNADLSLCRALPDAPVPWTAVDAVVLPRPSDACPICLYPMRAPVVTACGHVFDRVCMLQLFQHTNRCPLCTAHIDPASLRPCVFATALPPAEDNVITMRLVVRRRRSMNCHPHGCTGPAAGHSNEYDKTISADVHHDHKSNTVISNTTHDDTVPIVTSIDAPLFSRFAYSSPAFLLALVDADERDLAAISHEDPHLTPFINTAREQLATRRRRIAACPDPSPVTSLADSVTVLRFGDPADAPSLPKTHWFFYQDKQSGNAFLHPTTHRLLQTEYGVAELAELGPSELTAPVVQVDRYTMDDSMRRRYRFLDHLPDGCEFTFVELDISAMLSAETLSAHEPELRERNAARRRRAAANLRDSARAEQAESERLRQYCSSLANGGRPVAPVQPVDGTDQSIFPKLDGADEDEEEEEEGERETGTNMGASSSIDINVTSRSQFSSYSSVTSNMGLFPALGSSPRSADARSSQMGAWGGASSFPPPPAPAPASSRSHADDGNTTATSATVNWTGAAAAVASGTAGSASAGHKADSRRNGRRSNGKSTILFSTAGAQARR